MRSGENLALLRMIFHLIRVIPPIKKKKQNKTKNKIEIHAIELE